jgi:hypothetical protein
MQRKKLAPVFTLVTLAIECALAYFLWLHDPQLSEAGSFEPELDILWPFFLGFNILILPLIVLTMTRKDGPIQAELGSRSWPKFHLAAFSYPLGFYLSMGFCMPSLAGDPLMAGLAYGVSSALLPVFLVFLVAVAFSKYFEPLLNALYAWSYHWTGKILIAASTAAYLAGTIVIMYALLEVPGHLTYIMGAFFGAYLPLRVFLHYWGRGSLVGLVLIVLGMGFQQYLLWT